MTGKHALKRVEIADSAMDDKEMLEDLLVTAYADAYRQIEHVSNQKMSGATAGMPMPPGFKLPF
jgi:DNA-binding protein YbaB